MLATDALTIPRSLAMRQTALSPQLSQRQQTRRNPPSAPRNARGFREGLTVTMRNQTSLRMRTKMNRMIRVMSPSRDHRRDLPEGLSRRSGDPTLRNLDETMPRLTRQQRRRLTPVPKKWATSSILGTEQLHPVATQIAKLREETRTRISAVLQVGRAHRYSSCLLACTQLTEELLLTTWFQQLRRLHDATESDRVDPSLASTG